MLTNGEFVSKLFPPYDDEDKQVGPGRYGRRLAEFLAQGLESRGFHPQPLIAEDWGWMIRIDNEGFDLWVGCGNYDEYDDGFLCFIEPHKERLSKFLFFGSIDTTVAVSALQNAINEILTSEFGVSVVKWSTYEEFNNPS